MEKSLKKPALQVYERYELPAMILEDEKLCKWFAELCSGNQPLTNVDEEILAILEGDGIIGRRGNEWVLRPDGREFARKLGIIPRASKFEIKPELANKPESLNKARNINQVWNSFFETGDEYYRNLLMENYLRIVKYTADRIYAKLPVKIDLSDLISAGIFGLMDAIEAFDPGRGVKFETYCSPRIRGAILDELRSIDWVPRIVRARAYAHQFEKVTQTLEAFLDRIPTDEELAEELEHGMTEFRRLQRDATSAGWVSLSNKYSESLREEDIREIDKRNDNKSESPLVEAKKRVLKELLTKDLSRVERLIIILYYYEEMTMKEIAAFLDLSESRVSQMHSSIVARLKSLMNNHKK